MMRSLTSFALAGALGTATCVVALPASADPVVRTVRTQPPLAPSGRTPSSASASASTRVGGGDNPALLEKHVDGKYGDYGRHLFHSGVKVTDFNQGHIGDCYLAAAAAAVAHRRPDLIKQAFVHNPDKSVSVRLYDNLKPVTLKMDDRQVPQQGGGLLYASPHNKRHPEQWPGLLEKGFAQLRKGYGPLEGGSGGRAMEMITGKPSTLLSTDPRDTDKIYAGVKAASAVGHPMTAATFGKEWHGAIERLEQAKPGSPDLAVIKKLEGNVYGPQTGVYAWHVYTVLGVDEQNGQKMIVLRNPWGYNEPAKSGFGTGTNAGDDGIFRLSVDTFATLFQAVDVNAATAAPAPALATPAAPR